jgi:cyclase
MNCDGRKTGFDLEITEAVCRAIKVPVIASGGAGSEEDFVNLFSKTQATGGLAASIFHFNQIPIPQLKNYLKTQNIPIR